jgi:retron-type reverse transcriptase
LIKRRITPIIENQIGDSQMGFRKGKGTRDAIFQLRMISERYLQMGKKVYLCFVDYQKAFDRVNHDKLLEVMEIAGIPELERRLIINLYWHQQAAVRWDNEVSRYVNINRGVRQGCIISPLLFNLYSEYMIKEALDNETGIRFNGNNISNLRYADDAVLMADTMKQLQKLMDKLNETC